MQSLAAQIIDYIKELPEGVPVVAKGLVHLGTRNGVDKALSRLAKCGGLVRVGRGVYLRPVASRFGPRSPSVDLFVEALAIQRGEVIVPNGAAAANRLGLSTQVPVQRQYLTSGPSRTFEFGKQAVELRHAPRWQTTLGNQPAGEVVRALAWLGPENVDFHLASFCGLVEPSTAKALLSALPLMPDWIARCIVKVARV